MVRKIHDQGLYGEGKGDKYGGRRHTYRGRGGDIQGKKSIWNGNYIEKGVRTHIERGHT